MATNNIWLIETRERILSGEMGLELNRDNVMAISKRFNGIGPKYIADIIGCEPGDIFRYMTRGERRGTKPIDTYFWKTWTKELAYVLGILVTDGCVTDIGEVSFVSTDKQLMDIFIRCTACAHVPREHTTSGGRTAFQVTFRAPAVAALIPFGPRKSKSVEMPTIPRRLRWHFFRGVLDGDGSVFYDRKYTGLGLKGAISTASPAFAAGLAAEYGLVHCKYVSKSGLHKIFMSKRWMLENFDNVYEDSENLRLDRKKDKWLAGMTRLYERVPNVRQ